MNRESTNLSPGEDVSALETAERHGGGAALLRFSRHARPPAGLEHSADHYPHLANGLPTTNPGALHNTERLAKRLQLLLNALPGGVVVLDANGRVEECNPGANHILGHPLLGGVWRDIATSLFCPQIDDELDLTLPAACRALLTRF